LLERWPAEDDIVSEVWNLVVMDGQLGVRKDCCQIHSPGCVQLAGGLGCAQGSGCSLAWGVVGYLGRVDGIDPGSAVNKACGSAIGHPECCPAIDEGDGCSGWQVEGGVVV
jgi:hypothetical protein